MAEHSRRDFIRGVGVTAAAATVAVMAPGVASATTTSGATDDGTPPPAGAVVAYVADPLAGTVTVMRGEREVTVIDKALARKLAKLLAS